MTINDLIIKLEEYKQEHGDLPVWSIGPDCGGYDCEDGPVNSIFVRPPSWNWYTKDFNPKALFIIHHDMEHTEFQNLTKPHPQE